MATSPARRGSLLERRAARRHRRGQGSATGGLWRDGIGKGDVGRLAASIEWLLTEQEPLGEYECVELVVEAFRRTKTKADYGAQDVSLATKVLQVRQQFDAGTAVVVYDEGTESCTIQPANQLSDDL